MAHEDPKDGQSPTGQPDNQGLTTPSDQGLTETSTGPSSLTEFFASVAFAYQNGEWTPDHINPVVEKILGGKESTQAEALSLPAPTDEGIGVKVALERQAVQVLNIASFFISWHKITKLSAEGKPMDDTDSLLKKLIILF